MRQIVGIARTANYSTWAEPPQPCVYVPLEQNYSDAMTLYVRSKADPQQILMPVRREVRAAGPQILIGGTLTGREIVDGGLFQARMGVALLSVFGLLALGTRQHRAVRDHGLFRESAKAGDRVAHGVRRRAGKRAPADSEAGHVAGHPQAC